MKELYTISKVTFVTGLGLALAGQQFNSQALMDAGLTLVIAGIVGSVGYIVHNVVKRQSKGGKK